MESNEKLVKYLTIKGAIKSQDIAQAFLKIDRINFVDKAYSNLAYEDKALPIEGGQTISQPGTVAFMLEKLDVQKGNKVLDIGSGSGWTTALIAELVGDKGEVWGVEVIPALLEVGRRNLNKFHNPQAKILAATKKLGLPEHGPYDRILVSAFTRELPYELMEQLVVGGKMIIPINQSLLEIFKTSETESDIVEHKGYVFVPLKTVK